MENTHTLSFVRSASPAHDALRTRLARLGDGMARHRRAILAIQWVIVIFYAVLVILPAFLPLPLAESRLFSSNFGASSYVDPGLSDIPGESVVRQKAPAPTPLHDKLVLLAQLAFWGVWWPFVILATMLMGRAWCGVLCPEGALTEFVSRHGRGGRIPRWVRWSGWPLVAFSVTTIYGQLVSVYEYPKAVLVILGGSTAAAMVAGYLWGKGKRVWCRYLCPVSGVFALLARLAPLHFRVDGQAWNRHPEQRAAVDCAPLLDVKHLKGMAQCHACGRCSGHRDAVTLAPRSPNAEILGIRQASRPEALLLVFGIFGVAMGAFHWSADPWFVAARTAAAEWLVNHDILWPLADSPAWWLLTRYPEANDVFTLLDGIAILAYIGGVTLMLGGIIFLSLVAAARMARADWRRIALGLTPLAGASLFLGLTMLTVTQLRAEGFGFGGLTPARDAILGAGLLWSLFLGFRLLRANAGLGPTLAAMLPYAVANAAVAAVWLLQFHR